MSDTPGMSLQEQTALIQALHDPACYPHPVDTVELLETHISWVLLAGAFAYKIKKNLCFGFLDFSSLDKRKTCCEEELRLNRRQTRDLYLDVIPIVGTPAHPTLQGGGTPLEYAVKMRRFRQDNLLDQCLQKGDIRADHIDTLAQTLATFHQTIKQANADSTFGTTSNIERYTQENINVIASRLIDANDKETLSRYSRWLQEWHPRLAPLFEQRRRQGFVRECHGDLHLGNITVDEVGFHFFDCIEFNADLRWVDVVSELAFLAMDLQARGYPEFSRQLINRYVELTGDYAGVPLLPYYLAYRSMVRAKVAMLRLSQAQTDSERDALLQSCRDYLRLAANETMKKKPVLIITHGLSGSGKSTHTQSLVNETGAVRLRSDVERKRLFADNKAPSGTIDTTLYTADNTRLTYAYLLQSAMPILHAGINVIIDATCLRRWQRDLFRDAAHEQGFPFLIIDFPADIHTLEKRILQRLQTRTDPSDATIEVLHRQQQTQDSLADDEQEQVFTFLENDRLADQKLLQILREIQLEPDAGHNTVLNGATNAHKSTT